MMQTKDTGWRREHPEADVPAVISEHAELIDMSWHNDAMPSFTFKGGEDSQIDIRLWVDYADKSKSEFPDYVNRYNVTKQDWDANKFDSLYLGNDENEAIKVLISQRELTNKKETNQ